MSAINAVNDALLAALIWTVSLTRREEGQTMAEYGLILAGIAVVVFLAVGFLGTSIHNKFCAIGLSLGNAAACP